jgi:DNA end-binding protein Ku
MRSIWKGHIRFSLVTIPVQVFNAIDTSSTISFDQLHNEDHGRINYKRVCSECSETVEYGNIVKGYEYEDGKYVVLDKSDLDNLKIKSNRVLDIEAFVDIHEVHPSRFEAVYFVGPNEEIGIPTFNLLRKTLEKSGKAGVGRIVMRDREDVVLLMHHKNGMIMYKLRFPYEVRKIEDVPDLKESPINDAELELADTLVKSLEKKFEEIDFHDNYRDAMMELVQAKIDGKEVVVAKESGDTTPVVDIMDALKKSIEEAKKNQLKKAN